MPDSLEIPMSIKDFTTVMRQFGTLQKEILKTGELADKHLNFGGSSGSGGSGGPGGAGGTGMIAARTQSPVTTVRSAMRTAALHQTLSARVQGELGRQQQRLIREEIKTDKERLRLKKQELLVGRGGPKPFGARLSTFIRSTRFGAGGAEPLIGRTTDLLGDGPLGEIAGPVGVLAVGLIKATGALKDFVLNTNQAAQSYQLLKQGTGATLPETAKLTATAHSLGIDPSDLGGIAQGIARTAGGGGMGTMFAGSLGLSPLPQPFGNTDAAADLLTVIKDIRKVPKTKAGDDYLNRLATIYPISGLEQVRTMKPGQYNNLIGQASGLGKADSPNYLQKQQDLTASIGALKTSMDILNATFGKLLVGPAGKSVNWLNGRVGAATGIANDFRNNGKGYGIVEMLFDKKTADARARLMSSKDKRPGLAKGLDYVMDAFDATWGGSGALPGHGNPHHAGTSAQHPVIKVLNRIADASERTNTLMRQSRTYGNTTRGDFMPAGFTTGPIMRALGAGETAIARQREAQRQYQLSPF